MRTQLPKTFQERFSEVGHDVSRAFAAGIVGYSVSGGDNSVYATEMTELAVVPPRVLPTDEYIVNFNENVLGMQTLHRRKTKLNPPNT